MDMISYYSFILEAVSCTAYEIQLSMVPPSFYFATPLAFNVPDGGVPLGRSP